MSGLGAQVDETVDALRLDVHELERDHAAPEVGTDCPACASPWPCAPIRCATWLRRLVLERLR